MNIFVTGSNGYIGSEFIKKAAKKGFKIFAVTRKKKNRKIRNVKWLKKIRLQEEESEGSVEVL